MRDKSLPLPPAAVKSYAHMLLTALAHVHGRGLVHRDVKPDNLLVDGTSGVLKLADFGLARCVRWTLGAGRGAALCAHTCNSFAPAALPQPRCLLAASRVECRPSCTSHGCCPVTTVHPRSTAAAPEGIVDGADADGGDSGKWTHQVFGRWYRPPELLYGATRYGPAVDMWAVGCVLAELMLRRPWFPGSCDVDQLDRIFKALGAPSAAQWPGLEQLPHRLDFKPAPGMALEGIFPEVRSWRGKILKRFFFN